MPKSKNSVSRSSEAYDLLREDLIVGTLVPGSKLIITELQERYGIGAMPLREALNRLSAEKFVDKHDQKGFSVPPLVAEVFLEIQNARIVIESAALQESILAHEREWEDRLVLAFHHLSKAARDDPDYLLSEAWSLAHEAFHSDLISGCKNVWLQTFASQLYNQSSRYRARRRQIDSKTTGPQSLLDEHFKIMDAALRGDVDEAIDCLVGHYRRSVEIVLREKVELSKMPLRFSRKNVPAHEKPIGTLHDLSSVIRLKP
jgi:GntR family transcriptional regulator, carbon starvation induced regulator